MQAESYKKESKREKEEREIVVGKLDSLKRCQEDLRAREEEMKVSLKRCQEDLRTREEEMKVLQEEMSQVKQEAQAKVSQIKQYKKHVDAQEVKACYVLIHVSIGNIMQSYESTSISIHDHHNIKKCMCK